MAFLAQVTYVGIAAQQAYSITFNALKNSHIKAKINGSVETDFVVNAAGTTLTFTTPVIAGGEDILIHRVTPRADNERIVDFANGSVLTEDDLDTSYLQGLYVTQEVLDQTTLALKTEDDDGTQDFDALSKKIINLKAPSAANDAARLLDVQNAEVDVGNLPALSGQPDHGLASVADVWTVRTPTQMLAHFKAPRREVQVVNFTETAITKDQTATWMEVQASKATPTIGGFQGGSHYTPGVTVSVPNLSVIIPRGVWLCAVTLRAVNQDTNEDADFDWALTDELNSGSQTLHINSDSFQGGTSSRISESPTESQGIVTQTFFCVLDFSAVGEEVCLRGRFDEAGGHGGGLWGFPTQMLLWQIDA